MNLENYRYYGNFTDIQDREIRILELDTGYGYINFYLKDEDKCECIGIKKTTLLINNLRGKTLEEKSINFWNNLMKSAEINNENMSELLNTGVISKKSCSIDAWDKMPYLNRI